MARTFEPCLSKSVSSISSITIPAAKIKAFIADYKKIGITSLGYNPDRGIVLNDLVAINNNIDSVSKGLGDLIQGYDGSDIILGFIDTGIDFKHPDFAFGDGKTMIIAQIQRWYEPVLPEGTRVLVQFGAKSNRVISAESLKKEIDPPQELQ